MSLNGDLLGKRLGRYRIIEKVGVGGMAEVYLAETSSKKGIAIKKIMASYTNSEKFVKMFLDEAKIMITLRHPNIVELFDFGKIENVYYLAMEYVNGKPLASIIRRQLKQKMMFPAGLAVYITMEICSGLDYAHKKKDSYNNVINIVHRDISPPNILLSWDGEVKVADFGIAKAANKVIMTKPGILKGKFSYMSPEQARGEEIDLRSDIFSLGTLLYEMLTGTRLFLRDKEYRTIEAVRSAKVLSPKVYNPMLPEKLEQTVMKALERNPKRRFQSAKEFGDALEKVLTENYFGVNSEKIASFVQFLYPNRPVVQDKNERMASIGFWSQKAREDSELMRDVDIRIKWHRKSRISRFIITNWFLLFMILMALLVIGGAYFFVPKDTINKVIQGIFGIKP